MALKTYMLVDTASGLPVLEGGQPKRRPFEEGQQHILAPAKGIRWLLDEPPAALAHEDRTIATPIAAEAMEVPYTVANKPLAAVKLLRIAAAFAIMETKLKGNYGHGDGHAYQLGPDKTGRWGMDNITAMGASAGDVVNSVPGATWPANFEFVDAVNADVPMTAAEMYAMAMAARDYVYAVRRHFWDLRASIQAANSVAGVLAIDITTGWP